ncbi:MAG: PA2779 family protein [Rhodobacteraceae bacterium]|nr:PA2779 family protein [Paracoccaceae bacterium]
MAFKDFMKRTVAVGIAAQLLVATQYGTMAQAQMISTDTAINGHVVDTSRAALLQELQRAEIRDELVRQGIDPAEVEARLSALSDAEIQQTLSQMEDGSSGAGIVGTLGAIFIILLITDILCLTRLFNFTRCVR